MKRALSGIVALVLFATGAPAQVPQSEPPQDEAIAAEPPEGVGGLFGLFRRGAHPAEEAVVPAEEVPFPGPTVAEPASLPTPVEELEPTSPPTPVEDVEPTGMPADHGDEDAPAVPEGGEKTGDTTDRSPTPRDAEESPPRSRNLESDLEASRRPSDEVRSDDVELPSQEIRGELEKPDIFFLLPKARNQSDEQLIRARIRREITRPLIKEWLEEELLLK